MRVKSPFSQSALFGFMGSIYDGQADTAICEFCYENIELAVSLTRQIDETRHVLGLSHDCACIGDLATCSRDPASQNLKPIQSARAEHNLPTIPLPRAKLYVTSPIRGPLANGASGDAAT